MTGEASEVVTALFADICNYSTIVEQHEAAAIQRADQAVYLISSLISDYGGEVEHVAGDCVLAIFNSAVNALNLAISVQREMNNDSVWNSGETPIAFRIGVASGQVVRTRSGLHGHQLNIAARLQQMAPPGGILVSERVCAQLANEPGIRLRPLGRRRLKNIGELVAVSEVVLDAPTTKSVIQLREREREPCTPPAATNALAVLDLINTSGEVANLHLCSGITSDIIANLTRFRDLHVIAHRSSSMFDQRTQSVVEIGEMLGVTYLIAGNLTRQERRICLYVELLDARTEQVLWSERFDGVLEDVFAIRTELTSLVAARLSQEVASAEIRRCARVEGEELQAYGLLLRGKAVYWKLSRLNNAHARRLFEQARQADPGFSRSYVGISRTLNDAWRFHWVDPPNEALRDALAQAECAVQLDPVDARGLAALGSARLYLRQYERSLGAYERAIKHNPNDADVLAEMGHSVCVSGDPDRAIKLINKAMSLNPHYPDWYLWHLGEAYFDKCDYWQTISTLSQMGDRTDAHRMLTASYSLMGETRMATEAAKDLMRGHPEFSMEHWSNVPPDKNPEPRERLIAGLRMAGLK